MATDQRVEQRWATPTHDQIVGISQLHVQGLESSDADDVWQVAGMHHVVLRTIGRRSGVEHKVALPTWNDPEGVRVVVASFAGAPEHPAWFLNLRDTEHNAEVWCRVQERSFWSRPEVLERAERDRIWALLVEDRAWYVEYQAHTPRSIPLVRLPETRPA